MSNKKKNLFLWVNLLYTLSLPKRRRFRTFTKKKKKKKSVVFFFTRLTLSLPFPHLPLRFSHPLISLSVSIATTRIKVSILTVQSPSLFSPLIEDFVRATLGEFFSLFFSGSPPPPFFSTMIIVNDCN